MVIYFISDDLNEAVDGLNHALSVVAKWLSEHNFTLSPTKSKCVIFTKRKIPANLPQIKIENEIIPYEPVTQYLGIYFDTKLTWQHNIQHISIKTQQVINIM